MKTLVGSFVLFVLLACSVFAQGTSSQTVTGAVIGAGAGAIIGNNSKSGNAEKGALVGAILGGVVGNSVGQQRVISQQQRELDRLRGVPFSVSRRDDPIHAHERYAGRSRPEASPTVIACESGSAAHDLVATQLHEARMDAEHYNRALERAAREFDEARAASERANARVADLEEARIRLASAGAPIR